jgi:hypothetical protein
MKKNEFSKLKTAISAKTISIILVIFGLNISTFAASPGSLDFSFGLSTDKAVPGDYDKDGRTDVAIFRPSSGECFVLRSSSGNTNFFGFQFGANGDIPINGKGF